MNEGHSALLTVEFAEGAARDRAVGAYAAMAALGFVVGMSGGGVLTELGGWRWVFLVNVPVAVAALLPTRRVVEDSRGAQRSGPLDVVGALLAMSGVAGLLYAVSGIPASGWTSS